MCGIAGIWNRSGAPVAAAALDRMAAMLRHRGPDGEGRLLQGDLGLIHRRLTIVDLSEHGAQPMALPDESLWINFNGEIHNHLELRSELEDRGVAFRSHCDTEVALWAYRLWGADCFERFNGMWAMALWDADAQELVLSRDRFGIKPLYVAERGDCLAFASEPKAILAAFPDEREPDRDEILSFLAGGFPDVGDATFFRRVRALPAATFACYERHRCRRRTYWRFEPGDENPRTDAEEQFRTLLVDAVRLRMRSDVPVGATVSGGLDSTAVASIAKRFADAPLHSFSLRYDDDPEVDESAYARAATDDPSHFLVHWVTPTPDRMLEVVADIVWHHDAPTPARGRYAQWFVMREVGRHVKVLLEGTGSDEQLAGYGHFLAPYLLDRLQGRGDPPLGPRALVREFRQLSGVGGRRGIRLLQALTVPVARWLGREGRRARQVCRPDFIAAQAPVPQRRFIDTWLRADVERPFGSHLNNALWHEFRHAGLTETLHAADALSMAFSVESRAPFLDHRLAEFCFSLSFDEKIRDGWTKSLLRRALRDVLPEQVRTRRAKLGFPAPVGRWLRQPGTWDAVQAILLDPSTLNRGIFEPRHLERQLQAFAAGEAAGGPEQLWRWLTLELWFRQFVDRVPEVQRTFPDHCTRAAGSTSRDLELGCAP